MGRWYETKRRREGRVMHKMSKESAGKIASLQSRLDRAKKKIEELNDEIKLPIYGYDASEHDDIEGTEYVYDWEEMADELGTRIKETLNRNVVVIIESIKGE